MRNICVTYTGQIASGDMGIGRLGAGMTEGEVHHNPALGADCVRLSG
jgi:hypothetical protein